jgi:inner membrane protein
MDSLSQFVLGAAVGVTVMGRRVAPWKAALWGGALGTLPDLDALIDHGDPVRNMVLHRAETHALFWQTLAAPPIAAAIAVLTTRGNAGAARWRDFPLWLATVWLAFVTHALLDAMTVYGTRLALPFSDHPYGVGSIFIIDPLYTLPLIAGLVGALVARGARRMRWNMAGLVLSTAYLAWSAAAQAHVAGIVRTQIAARPDAASVERVLVTPTAFNTVLWRVLVMRPDGYEEGFRSLLDEDRPIRFTRHALDGDLYRSVRDIDAVTRIAQFSRGFFRVDERGGTVRITDLRMGQEPSYVFSFAVARRASAPQPLIPPVAAGGRGDIDIAAALDWLWRRAGGADIDPPG